MRSATANARRSGPSTWEVQPVRHANKRLRAGPRRRVHVDAPASWRRILVLVLVAVTVLAAGLGAKALQERRAHGEDKGLVTIGPHKD